MARFEALSKLPVKEKEANIRANWEAMDLLKRSIETREGNEPFVFYEGPPTANGHPGIHHVIARTLKDGVCRFKTMQGYQVNRKAGWDTHGLPVEIEVEKILGLNDKTEIEEYGIHNFNEQCKTSVFKYEGEWREMTKQMAYLIDLDNPYITLENDYIETEWWILNKFFEEGYIYEGHKIQPYCPRCGTGLASHEVAQGYEEITSQTVVVKMKRVGVENEYFLAWTTTPWTLAANVAIAVNPEEDYLKVLSKESNEVYYVGKALADQVIEGEYEVLETMKGKDMEHMEYEQLMPFVEADKKAFFVTLADYVTMSDGTGLVHIAPAFGEDDYQVGKAYNLPVLQPVDDKGQYTSTPWKGRFVTDDDLAIEIIKYLAGENKLYARKKVKHNYPHCWRCKTPLLYYAKPSWYIEMTKLKDKLIENNNNVEWYPGYVGEKRFGNWLENLNDWAISRSRYWGTPLNVWRCDHCDHTTSVGSRKELAERAIEDIDESIELHRPYVDDVHLTCDKCGSSMTRVKEVIDCWFDSGSMPFAQLHYPFENKEVFEQNFPADFICEGIDQTRGWFYSLLAISTFVTGKSPYKRVLVNDLILDKDGKKMSKSRGNAVNPFEMFEKYGADALRWYLLYVSPAWTPTKFDEDGLKEVLSKFFNTTQNVYNFFTLYANTDDVDPKEFFVPVEERPELDRWILSKFQRVLKEVLESMAGYDMNKVVRRIQDFVNEDLSNWYIRRSRRRFWGGELNDDKKAVYNTTYEVLNGLARMIAPFAPYLAEEMYQKLTGEESVHLATYPEHQPELMDDHVEERMDLVRTLVTLGRASREEAKIKVRQPIGKVMVDGKHESLIGDLVPLIQEELNVKEVVFERDLNSFMNFTIKPNFRAVGPKLGKKMGMFGKALAALDGSVYAPKFEAGESVAVDLAGEEFVATADDVQVTIQAKEGFNVSMADNQFLILDTTLTEELVQEGYARELVSKVQNLRKSSGFEVTDQIKIYFEGDEEIQAAVEAFGDYIKGETLAVSIEAKPELEDKQNLNGHQTGLAVEKL